LGSGPGLLEPGGEAYAIPSVPVSCAAEAAAQRSIGK